jgi:hypothetical protein
MTAPQLPFDFSSPIAHAVESAPASGRRRFRGQCARILERLRQGPLTDDELSRISRKYTGRISELRQAGYNIPPPKDLGGGLTEYRLVK